MPEKETPAPGQASAGAGIVIEQQQVLDTRPTQGPQGNPAAFDYAALSPEIAAEAQAVASRIRFRMRHTMTYAGAELARIKDQLPHGQFGRWLDAEFGMTERTAERYIQAARWLKQRPDIMSGIPPTVIYELAAPSTPTVAQDAVMARVAAGEKIKVKEVKRLIADAKYQQRQEKQRAARKPRKPKQAAPSQTELQRKREEREAAERAVVELLIEHLPDIERACELLRAAGHEWLAADIEKRRRDDAAVPLTEV